MLCALAIVVILVADMGRDLYDDDEMYLADHWQPIAVVLQGVIGCVLLFSLCVLCYFLTMC